jgi:hypothetical protein
MIELEVQFKLIGLSVLFAMVFTNLYTLVDIGLRKSKIVRFFVMTSYFALASIFYYYIIYKISKGMLSIYLPVSLGVGYYLHMRFYDKYFSCIYNYWFSRISSIIKTRKDRCKKRWIGHNLKKMKKEENLIE